MKIDLSIYERVNIYNANGAIFSTIRGAFNRVKIEGARCSSFYCDSVREIDLPIESIRNAQKLNFSKNDVFTIKYFPKDRYTIRNGRALFIPAELITVECLGEFLSHEGNGEKSFLTVYQLNFSTPQAVQEPQIKKIVCDNYTLKDGEKFGEWYGSDEAHAVISAFDTSKSLFNKGRKAERGILKKFYSPVIYNSFVVQSDYYTRQDKDAARVEREKIAEIMKEITRESISHYDVERLLTKLNISIKAGAENEKN